MSFDISVSASFSAAHAIKGMVGSCEKLHGHNWKVEIHVVTDDLDNRGVAIDYRELRSLLQQIVNRLDHSVLNEVPELEGISPTCENMAKYIFTALVRELPSEQKLGMVRIWESDYSSAAYMP